MERGLLAGMGGKRPTSLPGSKIACLWQMMPPKRQLLQEAAQSAVGSVGTGATPPSSSDAAK